jgi:hypothetical protein
MITKFIVFQAAFLFTIFCFADSTATVRVQTNLECTVGGQDLGMKHYDVNLPVKVYEKDDGSLWGTGHFDFDYAHPSSTQIFVFDTKNLSVGKNYPAKYAMNFSTFVAVYTGASWGVESSLIYFDSFDNFSAISQIGTIYTSEDKKDYCSIEAIMSPVLK